MNLPRFNTRGDVLSYMHAHKATLSPEAMEELVALHDALPGVEVSAPMQRKRSEVEALLVAAWREACALSSTREERERRLAKAVAGILGDDGIWKARRVYLLYLSHGVRRVNRLLLEVATRPGFEVADVDARFRALDRAVAGVMGRAKQGRAV